MRVEGGEGVRARDGEEGECEVEVFMGMVVAGVVSVVGGMVSELYPVDGV
jgi:hypothetical protein